MTEQTLSLTSEQAQALEQYGSRVAGNAYLAAMELLRLKLSTEHGASCDYGIVYSNTTNQWKIVEVNRTLSYQRKKLPVRFVVSEEGVLIAELSSKTTDYKYIYDPWNGVSNWGRPY